MAQNQRYMRDFEAVMGICEARGVAVQTIKSIARGPWATTDPNRTTWYQPLEAEADIDRAVHWVLCRPGIFLSTVGDVGLLPKVLDAASRFEAGPVETDMAAMARERSITPLFGIGT